MTTTAPSTAVATDIPVYTVDEPANQIFGLSMAMAEAFQLKGEAIGGRTTIVPPDRPLPT